MSILNGYLLFLLNSSKFISTNIGVLNQGETKMKR